MLSHKLLVCAERPQTNSLGYKSVRLIICFTIDDAIQERLRHLICSKQSELDFKVRASDVMPDHVHLILENNPKVPITRVVGLIKGYTSRVLREEFPHLKSRLPCLWTRSKFIASVGSVTLEVVKKYIEDQKSV